MQGVLFIAAELHKLVRQMESTPYAGPIIGARILTVNINPPVSPSNENRQALPPPNAIRVVIVASDALTRAGLASILAAESDLLTVGQFDPLADLESALQIFQPHVLLWDIGYAAEVDLNVLAAYVDRDSSEPTVPVLALLADGDAVAAAWNAGVRALVPRRASAQTLIAALQAAAVGLVVLDADAAAGASLRPSQRAAAV